MKFSFGRGRAGALYKIPFNHMMAIQNQSIKLIIMLLLLFGNYTCTVCLNFTASLLVILHFVLIVVLVWFVLCLLFFKPCMPQQCFHLPENKYLINVICTDGTVNGSTVSFSSPLFAVYCCCCCAQSIPFLDVNFYFGIPDFNFLANYFRSNGRLLFFLFLHMRNVSISCLHEVVERQRIEHNAAKVSHSAVAFVVAQRYFRSWSFFFSLSLTLSSSLSFPFPFHSVWIIFSSLVSHFHF